MNTVQGRMALAALGWSWSRLADEAGISRPSVARFFGGESMRGDTVEAMRVAFERAGCRFIKSGQFKNGVVPPSPARIEDKSGGNPTLPR